MKIRKDISANYRAVFFNGKTIRQRIDNSKPITTPKFAEIEDVAINAKCLAACPYCYTNALKTGSNFDDIIEKVYKVWGIRDDNDKPFQIAIGGAGEPTLHPQFSEFVKTVKEIGIMPNYTTNGMHLSNEVLQATEDYCGGVAVSFHPHIEKVFHKAIETLSTINTKLNCHVIVGDEKSFVDLQNIYDKYSEILDYIVVLPYQAVGRGKQIETEDVWRRTFEWINGVNSQQFAFGALFYPYLLNNEVELDIDVYEPEVYSGYRIFDDSFMNLRHSSYDLTFKE